MFVLRQALGLVGPVLHRAESLLRGIDTRRATAGALGTALVLTGTAALANGWVDLYSRPYVFGDLESVPEREVAIVPGCRVFRDGTPSPVLVDRLATARELYQRGLVKKILVSGDHRAPEYDETNAMWQWLVERGIATEDVFLDHAGLRTLDTMMRAKQVFGVSEAVICTQQFHLARSVFLARRSGIDAIGINADRRTYERWARDRVREFFAKTVSFVDSYLLQTKPRHLGKPILINGDARMTHDRWTGRAR